MFPQINIDPTTEETEALLERFRSAEKNLPLAPPKKKHWLRFLLYPFIIISCIPALLLVILRLPFIVLRKLRLIYIEAKEKQQFKENYEWDPDNWREFCFEPPPLKETTAEKKSRQNRVEQETNTEQLKNDWLADPSNIGKLVGYVTFESIRDYYHGAKRALFILQQVKELPVETNLKAGLIDWNLSVLTNRLSLPNHSWHFEKIALEKGFAEMHYRKPDFSVLFRNPLFMEAWQYFEGDVINCWP